MHWSHRSYNINQTLSWRSWSCHPLGTGTPNEFPIFNVTSVAHTIISLIPQEEWESPALFVLKQPFWRLKLAPLRPRCKIPVFFSNTTLPTKALIHWEKTVTPSSIFCDFFFHCLPTPLPRPNSRHIVACWMQLDAWPSALFFFFFFFFFVFSIQQNSNKHSLDRQRTTV